MLFWAFSAMRVEEKHIQGIVSLNFKHWFDGKCVPHEALSRTEACVNEPLPNVFPGPPLTV